MGNTLHKLAKKILNGSATEAEQSFMDAYYEAFETKKNRDDELTESEKTSLRNQINQHIQRRIKSHTPIFSRKWLPYAAASILLVALCWTWVFLSNDKGAPIEPIISATEVLPGGNRAVLTLANGKSIDLDETKNGITVSDKITYSDGSYVFEGSETTTPQEPRNLSDKGTLPTNNYTLTTPKGGTYHITLPDGTQVWLNAASTLKYPRQFADTERVVDVTGEAYFAVAKDESKPFKVNSSDQTIVVRGTEFNISAYPEKGEIKTTLIEGSVTILNLNSDRSTRLNPGEQAIVTGSLINVSKVNVEPYTAWKEGYFYFDNVPPGEAIEQVARWYDLEVEYEDPLPSTFVFGMVERTKPLSSVLNSLGQIGLDFEIEPYGSTKKMLVSTRKQD